MTTRFKDLNIGQTFDWIDDENPNHNSFFQRCRKVSASRYETTDGRLTDCRVGTTSARVFHIQEETPR